MIRTGIPLEQEKFRQTQAGTVVLFDQYSRTKKSRIFEVRNFPVVLSAFGLGANENIVLFSVTRIGDQELEQPFKPEGKNIYLNDSVTSIEISLAGRYRAVLQGDLGEVICTYKVQQADIGRDVGMPSGVQANRPNLLFKEAHNGDISKVIEIADAPWVLFAFGLSDSDKIEVYQVYGEGPSFREELYKPDGKQILFSSSSNSYVLDKSGRYRFKYYGINNVTLAGNPTTVEIQGKGSSGDFSGTTDDVPEGIINLYFTEERARIAAGAAVSLPNIDNTPLKPGWTVTRQGAGYVRADARNANKSRIAGLVVGNAEIPIGESFAPQIEGIVHLETLQWEEALGSPGGLAATMQYYLEEDGIISPYPPEDTGDFIVPIGLALSATDIHVRINLPIQL